MHFTTMTSTAIYLALISGTQAAPHKGGFHNRLLAVPPPRVNAAVPPPGGRPPFFARDLPPQLADLVGVPGIVAPLPTPVDGAVPPLDVAQLAAVPAPVRAVKRHLADSIPADTPTVDLGSSVEEDDLDMEDDEVEDIEMDDSLREVHIYKRRIAALYRNRVLLAAYAGGYPYMLPSRLARHLHA